MMSNPTHKTLLRMAQYLCAFAMALAASLFAQSFSTTTVQGTVYLANGKAASGTVQISWPGFSTAAGQAVTAGRTSIKLGGDGFLSVALAPNQGATPAGLYYTVVYNLSDGSTATEYWTVPAAAQAAIAQVRAQVMPAAQAVQAVSKAYVDQAVQQISTSQMSSSGGTLSGPLYLSGDPLVASQAANKHYVDGQFAQALPRSGGIAGGPLTGTQLGAVYQVDQMQGADFGAQMQACVDKLAGTNGGTCDARNFPGTLTMANDVNVATANLTVYLPCATITTNASFVVAPGTRNVTLHGCASRGTSAASGSQGGTVFAYSGSGLFFKVGDPAYVVDTLGFHLDNVVVNTTAAPSAGAQALAAYRTQEMHLESLYLLGNANQTGMTLDGTGNYTGGTFTDVELVGFQTGINAIGHQVANSATTDWLNASTFLRPHIVCPVSNGNPIAGTVGINLAQGDGNTFTGGDVEGCATALHLGANAQNNTIVGLRNENSISQVVADAGSSYNSWISGGTMFTGRLTDNGTRNSFMDTFHRAFNSLNGDWFGTQQDATLTNHYRLGIGAGNERGLLTRYQTDYGYRWTMGLSDASAGAQFYQVQDELNNVYRLSIGQYNPGQPSTNNQTVLNAAGTGAVLLNGSTNAGTGGVVFGSGGPSSKTVATVDKAGNANFTGTLQVGGTSQSTGTMTVRNNADAEVDYYLWPGLTTNQKGSFTYKDYAGISQWYMVKDASNNWALNSAVGGLDSIKAYQSNNSGDTYINASNASGVVRVNYETGAGAAFNVYGGSSSNLYASFSGASAIKFPGLAAGSGKNCLQIDAYGWMSNTGSPCGSGGGTVSSGNAGQIAYYTASGTSLGGLSAVPLASGGTGASDAPTALANLGALPAVGGTMTGALNGTDAVFSGSVTAGSILPSTAPFACAESYLSSADGHGGADYGYAINAANRAASLTSPSAIRICVPGNHSVWTPIVFDRPIHFDAHGSKLIPQSGGASGVWGATPVTITNATATAGSNIITVSSTAGLSAGMAIGGLGITSGSYITCVYPTAPCTAAGSVGLSLTPSLTVNVFVNGSTTAYTSNSLAGIAAGQGVTGTFIPNGTTISAVNTAEPQSLTLSQAATDSSNSSVRLTVSSGTWTIPTITAAAEVPVITWKNNSAALQNEYGQNIGGSQEGVWIFNGTSANSLRTLSGVQGEQIYGWDGFVLRKTRIEGATGTGVVLGGYLASGNGGATGGSVRESYFYDLMVRYSGALQLRQPAVALMSPSGSQDEINQISFVGLQDVTNPAENLLIGTYNSNNFGGTNGPRLVWFSNNSQFEAGSYLSGSNFVPAQADSIHILRAGDVYFVGDEINGGGFGYALLNIGTVKTVSVSSSRVIAAEQQGTYTVSVSNGSAGVALISGTNGNFVTDGSWDGMAAILTDASTCASGCVVHLKATNAVSSATALSLASPYTGSSTTATLLMPLGSYITNGSPLQALNIQGNELDPGSQQTYSALGDGMAAYSGVDSSLYVDAINPPGSQQTASNTLNSGQLNQLQVENIYDAAYLPLAYYNARNLAPGHRAQWLFGQSFSNNNDIACSFLYTGPGSPNNLWSCGLYGNAKTYSFDGNGNFAVPTLNATSMNANGGSLSNLGNYGFRFTPAADSGIPYVLYGTNHANSAITWKFDQSGNFSTTGTVGAGNASQIIYRCTSAGTLPVGALTTVQENCGASVDSGLRGN